MIGEFCQDLRGLARRGGVRTDGWWVVGVELRPDRKDKRLIGGYFDMQVSQQLRILAAEKNTTIQELVREFLNDGFQKHGKSRIA
jgi:hypothetical protein